MPVAEYSGGCHCGAIGFRYTTGVTPADWSIRACQCRFCRMHDALSTSDPSGELRFIADDPMALSRYRFSLRTADFLLCCRCGVYIGAAIDTDDRRFGIINTRALEVQPVPVAAAAPISYAAEDTPARVSRREERWTPVTAVPW